MHIGVDIDGVIADTFPLLVRELNEYFKVNLTLQDICDYNIFKIYGLSETDMSNFIHTRGRILIEGPALKENAARYISVLSKAHTIHLISARQEEYYHHTQRWLREHSVCYHSLTLLGKHDKREICGKIQIDTFVEDSLNNARQISSCGIPVLLLDAPYNQGNLPPLVRRFFSWNEVFQELSVRSSNSG